MSRKSTGSRKLTFSCILAALVLSAVTLAVFNKLQNYGPESTVRKFNIAAASGDVQGVQNEIEEPITSPNSMKLVGLTQRLFANGAVARIRGLSPKGNNVDVEIIYSLPNGRVVPMIFVVHQSDHVWLINPTASFKTWRELFGMPT